MLMKANTSKQQQTAAPDAATIRRSAVSAPDTAPRCAPDPTLPLEWGVPERHLRVVQDCEPQLKIPLQPANIAQLAKAIAEVGYGTRPAHQLNRWVEAKQLALLKARGGAVQRHPAGKTIQAERQWHQVRGIRIMPVSGTVAEVSAVLVGSRRACAVALRLEAVDDAWLVTAVRLG
jgi:hypothetical protein